MPLVLVHGNPETAAVWEDFTPFLEVDEVICLSPPGFGAPIPDDFTCTFDAYRDWLSDELEKLQQPVDLMGHDWGGIHVLRIAMERPDLIRSWITDVPGVYDPDYAWHQHAQGWQQPGIGEKMVAGMTAVPAQQLAKQYESVGMSAAVAEKVAMGANDDMGRAILSLYRSAAQPALKDVGEGLENAASNPGLAIIATEDIYAGGETLARRAAQRANADVSVFEGLGHWWMCQDPEPVAQAVNSFLKNLG
ncbi:MAG: alpha/beta hydrolase [Pseudomonadota bacterium]